jgi:deazaflavin-dependent oxidoreductase (nitroreductase family)
LKTTNPSSNSKSSNFDQEKFLYLSTRGRKGGRPRQIEIWFTYLDGRFYVIAEYATSQWVKNLQADPAVQVRVADQRFSAQARIITPETESALHAKIQNLSTEKYGWGDGTVVELVPRDVQS